MKLSSTGALMPIRWFSRVHRQLLPVNGQAWCSHDGLFVISSLDDMYLPGSNDTAVGPTWLVSVSHHGARPTDDHMTRVVDAFAMPAFDEDNHYPGISRGLFCPVEEVYRHACECKINEMLIVEADGFAWTTPTDGPCRGCELEALDAVLARAWGAQELYPPRRCPIHSELAGAQP